ncbi:MAG: APC family permease [Thermoplasmata archaeon]|nr:MAG: APC family permease [Thermoplasmata archaeon]
MSEGQLKLPIDKMDSKAQKEHLRAYKDIKCPLCGSYVYWGTHSCRRCGAVLPEELKEEVDRRSMMHYITVDYNAIARERTITYIIFITFIAIISLTVITAFNTKSILEDIRINYIVSWAFFICIILGTMATLFYLANPKNKMLNKSNLLFTLIIMGISGLCIGFVAMIQVAVYGGSGTDLLACAIFIILSASSIAGGRRAWPLVTPLQIIFLSMGITLLSWPLIKTVVNDDWWQSFIGSVGGPLGSFIVIIIGVIALIASSYFIFNTTTFNIKMNNCYPTWLAGMIFLALFTFLRAALFEVDLTLSYVQALLCIMGILLFITGFLLLLRKKLADRYIQNHLKRSKKGVEVAARLYDEGDYEGALKRYENLITDNPCIAFGSNNSHPTLEILGITFVHTQGKRKTGTGKRTGKESLEITEPSDQDAKENDKNGDEFEEEDKDKEAGAEGNDEARVTVEEEEEMDAGLILAEAEALFKKSILYEKSGMRQKALNAIEQSIKLDRSRADSWIRLGHLISQKGGDWDKIKGYYNWSIDLKLHTIQAWVEKYSVPSQYTLWLLEELALLKKSMLGMGKTLRTLRSTRGRRESIVKSKHD